jgi:hypothetical protein
MPLSFPLNPTINQLYTFGDKTWVWNGYGWALNAQGAINNIPIGNVTPSTGKFTSLSATGNVTTAQYFLGNGALLTGINTVGIQNGTSNVSIPIANGNINLSVGGTSNIAVFSTSGGSITGNLVATGNITGNYYIGNGSQLTGVVATGVGVLSSLSVTGNTTTGNLLTGGLISATGNITSTGNITGNYVNGNGAALVSVMSDRGNDTNNWNTLTQMGVYTVNRNSWSGTVGTPLDSQVYVGLLEVKNSTDNAIEQLFYPGTVENGNVKIQWNRANWGGSWTAWVKIVNDFQVVQGGEF